LEKTVLITGARVALNAFESRRMNFRINDDRLSFNPTDCSNETVLQLNGYLVLPGLINAHDHLELNLFPRLGNRRYLNATDWALDIFHPDRSPIKEHLAVPKDQRLLWGALKNLVAGVTTVAHHNPVHHSLVAPSFPLNVFCNFGWAHSIHFSSDWLQRFQTSNDAFPFILHAAEGLDASSAEEIEILFRSGALTARTVIVHGVAAGRRELKRLRQCGSSLIWCPSSNHFTLGRTLSSELLDSGVPICLGSDSALTAKGDLLDEIEEGAKIVGVDRLYAMVTSAAASILRISPTSGTLVNGAKANLLIVRDCAKSPAETLLGARPEIVFVRGKIALASKQIAPLLGSHAPLHVFEMEDRGEYRTTFSVRSLYRETRRYLPSDFKLAGKTLAA
jgi:cytosine/adenosine deaminase-related metal-dependent hydrolase